MIDLHSHVLPGIDDGPESLDQSLEILRAAAADGVTKLAATPHVREDYPTRPETMERLVAELNEAVRDAQIPADVLPGGELDLSFLSTLDDETLRRFGLGGNPRLLLVEFPYVGWPLSLRETLFDLRIRGFSPVLAHPERNADVQREPQRLRPLVDDGILVQLTAASIDGRLGRRSAAAAFALLADGLAHMVASDSHAPELRSTGMTAALEQIGDEALARWLTDDVPAALLTGTELPARPEPSSRRSGKRTGARRLWPSARR